MKFLEINYIFLIYSLHIWCIYREHSISLLSALNKEDFDEDNSKSDKDHTLEQKTTFTKQILKDAPNAKDNRKENARITKVSFGSPCEFIILEELEEKPFQYDEEFVDNFNEAKCTNDELQECEKEEDAELTTSK